ncbi:MAG: acetyl-CoA carboxylase carboxyltransferase subunit alpha [Alphaproteobacteria bacterium]|nr:acetyl-CoA carboxylase carboxyltransferase subunit alpha [Alphaproteobacteria bacterium]
MPTYLDFEKPIADLEGKIAELRHQGSGDSAGIDIADEVAKLQAKVERQIRTTYTKLTAWQRVQVARHPERPHAKHYIAGLVEEFTPLAGDRGFAEDAAIMGGLGRIAGRPAMIIGQEKGDDTESRVKHNFGMVKPEGYRKAQRLMQLADRFGLPVVTFVDTAGAYPGIDAEERGQGEAIARSIEVCLDLRVPLVSLVIGEGGSGGAIAIAAANRVLMMEHSVYSVITPEGCASILWRSAEKAQEAAEAMRMTSDDLKKLAICDEIVPEPVGGAHRDPAAAVKAAGDAIARHLADLENLDGDTVRRARRDKFLAMGQVGL